MKKFGLILNSLGSSQLAYSTIKMLNSLTESSPHLSPYIFYLDASRQCINPKFATMHVNEIWGFDGPVIATSLASGLKLKASPGPTQKILYLWDLEWINSGYVVFEQLRESIEGFDSVWSRSISHANAMNSIFKLNVETVLPEGDVIKLVQLLGYDYN